MVLIQQKVWLITGLCSLTPYTSSTLDAYCNGYHLGTSSGFGKRLVASVLARGDLVIATARSIDKLQSFYSLPGAHPSRLHLLRLDITDSIENIQRIIDEARSVWGRIDVLVNNAGYGLKATIEEGG